MRKFFWIISTIIFLFPFIAQAQVSGSLWKLTGTYLFPISSAWGLAIPSLANNSCLGTDSSGHFQAGTCSGGSFASTTPWSLGSLLVANISGANTIASSSLDLPNGALQNSSITVNGTTFNLGDSKTVAAASSTLLSDNNTFSGTNIFTKLLSLSGGASTTQLSSFGPIYIGNTSGTAATTTLQGNTTGTSTIQGFLNVTGANSTSTISGNLDVAGNFREENIVNALQFDGTAGVASAYGGTSCTNQFPISQNAAGVWTCSSVTDSFFSGQLGLSHGGTNASLSGANQVLFLNSGNTAVSNSANLTFNGTLLNLTGNASSTLFSNVGTAYFGGSATTTIDSAGDIALPVAATFSGANLSSCSGAGNALLWTSSTKLFGCASGYLTSSGAVTSLSGTTNQITTSGSIGAVTLSLPNLVIIPLDASTTQFSVFGKSYFGGTSTTTIASDGSITTPTASHNSFANSTTTNQTITTYMEIPSAANPEPTIKASCSQSTNSPYQIQCGNNAAGTSVYDDRTGISFPFSSTTAMTASTTEVVPVPTGFTATAGQCTVQPSGATAEIEWYYANPTAYTSVTATYWNASSTPGQNAISSNNTPATNATSTMIVGNFTGSPTSVTCNVFGPITGI